MKYLQLLDKTTILLTLIFITYIIGALVELIDVDSAQYASIAMEMVQTGTYLQVFEAGKDYLDKPPLIFWLGALFFKIFGLHDFVFKLPILILSAVSLLYSFKLGKYLFNNTVGKYSAIILSTNLGFLWINSDVKTDILVANFILISVFYLIRFIDENKLRDLCLGSICLSFAMMSKGPMGIIFPGVFCFLYILITKKWTSLLRLNWTLLPLIIFIFLLPMIIGLYQQFDLHPEKLIIGRQGVSGVKFFFWDQSFGRITGTNIYKNDTSFFYLFHCLLLLIFPYSLILFRSIWSWIRNFSFFNNNVSFLLISVFCIMFALSLSSYKIPHYASVVIPFCSIILANSLFDFKSQSDKVFLRIYYISLIVISVIVTGLLFYIFKPSFFSIILLIISIICSILFSKQKEYTLAFSAIGLFWGILIFSHFLPNMHNYSTGIRFKNLIEQNSLSKKELFFVNRDSRAMEFYLKRRVERLSWSQVIEYENKMSSLFYMERTAVKAFENDGLKVKSKFCLDVYDMNRINMGFLNPKTRERHIENHCLIEFF